VKVLHWCRGEATGIKGTPLTPREDPPYTTEAPLWLV
jgi:hypothetical protein